MLLLLILGYCLVLSLRSEWQIYRLKRELAQVEATRQELLLKRQALEREKQRLNDPVYLEGVVREELGLVRPGEVLVVPGDRLAP
ncbi:MAG: FtsB family cell division protein [Moorellales bacterium]